MMDHESVTVHTIYFNNTFPAPSDNVKIAIGVITFFSGLSALIVDGGVAFIMLHYKILTNRAFAILYMNMVFCECTNLFACVVYMSPVIGFNLKWVGDSPIGHSLAHITMTLWTEVTLTTLVVSVNRYVAIARPHQYMRIFSIKNCVIMLICTWIVAIIINMGLFWPNCILAVMPDWLGLVYSDNTCGQALFAQCAITCTISIGILITFNALTWRAMRKLNKAYIDTLLVSRTPLSSMKSSSEKTRKLVHLELTRSTQKEIVRRRQVEITYFKQALMNAVCMEGMIVSYHGFTVIHQSPMGFYIFGMWPFMMVHVFFGICLDQYESFRNTLIFSVLMLYMNRTLQRRIKSIWNGVVASYNSRTS